MALKEDRYSMSSDRYIAKNFVLVYFEDAISQLLAHREENPKVDSIKFLSQYFASVRDGNHTMFREFAFIRSTPHNRASFVRLFWKCFRQIGKKGDLLSIQEYHSLLGLLCTDFPFQLVQKTARIVLIDDALDCLISFSDFIYAFQVQFYFEEFLDQCSVLYQGLLQSASPRDPVIVPTSNGQATGGAHSQLSHHPADGVEAKTLFHQVYVACDRVQYSKPPMTEVREILFATPRISFYGFLMAIAKSDAINEYIGRLPPKAELFEGVDVELSSPTVRLTNGARIQPPSASLSQGGAAGVKMSLQPVVSSMVRGKLSERASHIRAQQQSALETSDSDDTSTDSTDD